MNRRTFLLTWNPELTPWDALDEEIEELQETGILENRWSCGMRRDLPINSRVFLIRLGKVQRGEPQKGIIASGLTLSMPYPSPHWNREKAQRGETALYIDIQFDVLSNQPIIRLEELARVPFAGFPWASQVCGIEIPLNRAAVLEAVWQQRTSVWSVCGLAPRIWTGRTHLNFSGAPERE